jgi:hypothetical protein
MEVRKKYSSPVIESIKIDNSIGLVMATEVTIPNPNDPWAAASNTERTSFTESEPIYTFYRDPFSGNLFEK